MPFDQHTAIVIACDNSGSIGVKPADEITVPSYAAVSYFSFRVAYMECAAAGGDPFAVALQNFNGDAAWPSLIEGIERGVKELGIQKLPVTGSTESNFPLMQSATGITVLGKKTYQSGQSIVNDGEQAIAVIGLPLVGNEVLEQKDKMAPLWLFHWFCQQEAVKTILPVGSKGILYELHQLYPGCTVSNEAEIDLHKSAGPATCFIIAYLKREHNSIAEKAGKWFHLLFGKDTPTSIV